VADPASLLAEGKAAEHAPPAAPRRRTENPPRAPRRTPASAGSNGNGATAKATPPAAPPANGAPAAKGAPAGLTKRVPRSAGGERAVPGGESTRAATTTRRSPDEVRSMLSNYRSGMQRGRTGDDAATPTEDTEK
jgi:hypothetical protein